MAERAIYFKDMVQRRIDKPMLMRLVFRHPIPCFDCDRQIREYPGLLREIVNDRCLVFIGAGFCMPAGGPTWAKLLKDIARKGRAKQE